MHVTGTCNKYEAHIPTLTLSVYMFVNLIPEKVVETPQCLRVRESLASLLYFKGWSGK